MRSQHRGCICRPALGAALWCLSALTAGSLAADELLLRDGRVLSGKQGMLDSLVANEPSVGGAIVMVDDGLRRYFIPFRQIQDGGVRAAAPGERLERYLVPQTVPEAGNPIASLGPIVSVGPWDDFGRRLFQMRLGRDTVDVIQGITEITPRYTVVESLRRFKWEMRISTSSIPRDTLSAIFARYVKRDSVDDRLKVVRLYLNAERYEDARGELEQVIADFPDRQADFAPQLLSIRQLSAQRLLLEANTRADAGQHAFVYSILEKFPAEDVAGEILQEVREKLANYNTLREQGEEVLARLDTHAAEITDAASKARLEPILVEIKQELNFNTLDRMAAFRQIWDDAEASAEEKLSMAVTGWLLGGEAAERNLLVALSLVEVRGLVREYINDAQKLNRQRIVQSLGGLEGADPEHVARLLAHMKPPLETPTPELPGFYELSVPGLENEPPVPYYVQLPPAYDPLRRYPTVVTLHGGNTSPQLQIDWWAGSPNEEGVRLGQAGRYGAIVIAPAWAKEHQKDYEFTAREHAAVLNSLRDACRRFSIDTDRVYLSGHSMGGDAAWDLGLSHPDLWAGVIPIVGRSEKYCSRYWENGRHVPFYVVCGEMDGDAMAHNALDLDRYFRKSGFNVTVAEFLGRGHEHFSDEILALFDWMGRNRRDFFPREFKCSSLRPWDNFFWWVEVANMPEKSMIDPADWPPPRNTQAIVTSGKTLANSLSIRTGGAVSVWLTPELIDFTKRGFKVTVNGAKINSGFVEADINVMLEDVRTRADRQHPFWAKVESGNR